jgi:hypothetical protein
VNVRSGPPNARLRREEGYLYRARERSSQRDLDVDSDIEDDVVESVCPIGPSCDSALRMSAVGSWRSVLRGTMEMRAVKDLGRREDWWFGDGDVEICSR